MSFFDLMDTPPTAAAEAPLEFSESGDETDKANEETDEPEDIDLNEIEELDPYRSDAAEVKDDLFDEKPNKSPVPPPLIRIDENKCVDEDGVVHAVPKAEAPAPKAEASKVEASKPESAESKIPDLLIRLFGDSLIVR